MKEDLILKKAAIHQLNENVRKLNSTKSGKKKKTFAKNKNLTVKLSAGVRNEKKNYKASSSKGSFVQEFKKIRKEIEDELKREEAK